MRPRVYFCSAAMLACFILVGASSASAQHIQDRGYFREATSAAYAQLPFICTAPDCVSYPTDAYTTDYAVAQVITIVGAVDGETFTFKAVEPDSTVLTEWVITYHSTQCFTWSGGSLCNNSGYATFWTGPLVNCQPTGSWTLQFYDNSTLTVTHQFNLSHNASGPLGITSPTANQLIQLTDQNYTATPSSGAGAALFSAGTNGGGTISWTATQSYNTSQGYGYTTSNLPPFNTANGQGQVEIYQSTGGQVKVTAQTTTSSGTVQDCVTFYVEGTQLFDPTGQLLSLYATGATPHLMTGIAQVESSYLQFFSQNLLGATALWPHESYDGGCTSA